jgi:hypothetical protein
MKPQELIAIMAASIYVRSPGPALMLQSIEEAKLLWRTVLASDRI